MRYLALALAILGAGCPAVTAPAPRPPEPVRAAPRADAGVASDAPADTAAPVDAPAPAALAPPEPTLRLPRNFVPTGYQAELAVTPGQPAFSGTITIAGDVKERSAVIWLHGQGLAIQHASARGEGDATAALAVTPHGDDLLELRADPPLAAGHWQLALAYTGKIDRTSSAGLFEERAGGAPYVLTQLEAIYARRVFPCVDEPDVKVPWQLTLDVPEALVAASNTPVESETPLGNGAKRVVFARTRPLPSYLVAFGIGPFDVVDAGKTKSGTPVRVLVPKGRAAQAAWAAQTAPRLLELLEAWFGLPYPYAKLDLMTVPLTGSFEAMENAGLVTYASDGILLDPRHASRQSKHDWVVGAAHELAHQWVGDYVTPAWWDDAWLNEAFATFLERAITAQLEPDWHEDRVAESLREDALRADSLVSARRIRQPIATTSDILGAFDTITYDKGAAVLAMFEHAVGPEVFRRAVHDYLSAHAYGTATAADFLAALDDASGKHVAAAVATFLDQPGAPELEARLACTGGPPRVELAQHRYVPPGAPPPAAGPPWSVPVCVAYEQHGSRAEACTELAEPTGTLALAATACPRWLLPNAGATGYYRAEVDVPALVALRDEAWPLLSPRERRALFFEASAAARHGELPLQLALSFVPRLLGSDDRLAIGDGVHFVLGLEPFVPDALRRKYEVAVRELFAPGATRLGALPRPDDDLAAETVRALVFGAAAWHGRDPDLVKQAVDLADHWRDLPEPARLTIVRIAADASAPFYARLLHELPGEHDRQARDDLIAALASTRDPAQLATALPLLLDRHSDLRELAYLLSAATTDATRDEVLQFFRAHDRELIARWPDDGIGGGAASVAYVFAATCDAARRADIVDYLTKHLAPLPGGQRPVQQAIERMDQCIARRAAIEPEIRAWLEGLRLPRPETKHEARKRKRRKQR